jgi:hypothetical protein
MYDLLLLDVLTKGIDGFELYDKMRKIDESIHICFYQRQITYTKNTKAYILKFRTNVSYKSQLGLKSSHKQANIISYNYLIILFITDLA